MPGGASASGGLAGRRIGRPPAALIRICAIALVFVLAAWGFAETYARLGRHPSLADDLFDAAQLVIGRYPADLDGKPAAWTLAAARWALPPLTLWTTLALGWAQARNPLRLAILRLRGDHLVIAGDAGLSRHVALSERARGGRVLLWPTAASGDWTEEPMRRGAARVDAVGDTLAVGALALDKARGVLLLAPDDTGNTALAVRVVAQVGDGRAAGDPLNIIARIDNLDLRRGVEERFARAARSAARVRFASLPDIAARELFVDQPLDAFRRDGDLGRRVFVFGYSAAIERYLLRVLAGGHFRDEVRPAFVVVDPRGRANAAAFHARNPGADALSPIRFESGDLDQARLGARMIDELTQAHGPPVAIVIDTGEDARSLALALEIDEHHARADLACPPIHVHLSSPPDAGLSVAIRAFGGLDHVADPEMLLQERHDALARSIHDFYLEGRMDEGDRIGARASMREWEDLPESFRDDNRLVADCYQLKLRDIGARLVADAGAPLRFEGEELEELARAEHDRWVAAKLATGWTHGATRDDAARRHPDIVGYDALSDRIKDLDREQIRVMTRLLGATGARAVRVLTVALHPGGHGIAEGLPNVFARLADQYPDRVPIVTGLLADPAARAALLVAAAAGHRVALIVAGNVQRLLDALPPAERDAAWALVRGADTINACAPERGEARLARADLMLATVPVPGVTCAVVVLGADGAILAAPWKP